MNTITASMEAELIRLFNRFDADGSGLIDRREFGLLLDALGYGQDEDIRDDEFARIDSDDDGRVRFREFADWWLALD